MSMICLLAAIGLAAAEQWIKYMVVMHLQPVGSATVIEDVFHIYYLENGGGTFGLFENRRILYEWMTVVALLLVLFLLWRYQNHTRTSYATVMLLLGGGLSNLFDQLRLGYVVDYLHIEGFGYVFNLADLFVTVGIVLLAGCILAALRKERKGRGFPEPPELAA